MYELEPFLVREPQVCSVEAGHEGIRMVQGLDDVFQVGFAIVLHC